MITLARRILTSYILTLCLLSCLLLCSSLSFAEQSALKTTKNEVKDPHENFDFTLFETLPILDEGRLKPMKSFAILKLKTISSRESLPDKSADLWLAELFFTPRKAADTKSFNIDNKTLKAQLLLPEDQKLFSIKELQPGLLRLENEIDKVLEKQDKQRSNDEKALLDLYKRAGLFMSLSQSVSMLAHIDTSTENPDAVNGWQNLQKAYQSGDHTLWQNTLVQMHANIAQAPQTNMLRFEIENIYRTIKPYAWIITFYALGILLCLLRKPLPALAITALAIGFHGLAIIARIYILGRPPVGTLYESALFVSLITAILGWLLSAKNKNTTNLLAGNLGAIALLAFAPFITPDKDNLEVLVAVLNTDFWLGTHVICITIGYGVCILASLLAHIALAQRGFGGSDKAFKAAHKNIYRISITALLFTAVGTILGGIWADQSWGRFWGWDPKENGALLIVLWLIWILHGRVSQHIKPILFMALTAALSIIVALAWLGVNLLSVGLHSYGFTSGMAAGLAAFCTAEIITISALTFKAMNKQKALS